MLMRFSCFLSRCFFPVRALRFWDLYHSAYAPLDEYGGGYGNFVPPPSAAAAAVQSLIRGHAATVAAINAASASPSTCVWAPPKPAGAGCASLVAALELGAMPWACQPGEPENVNSCAPAGSAARLFRDPPPQWRGASSGKDLPFNAVEALVMGKLLNNGSAPINLRGAWLVVPFSRGVHTKYEGEWLRVTNPNAEFTRYCWFASEFKPDGGFVYPYVGDLCSNGALNLAFTEHMWPEGTKRDRGLNISFTRDVWLGPGQSIHAGSQGQQVLISFKTGLNNTSSRRLDVSSLELAGARSCPLDPGPAYVPPPAPGACPHPLRACPQPERWAASARNTSLAGELPRPNATLSVSAPQPVGERLLPGAQYHVSARVRLTGLSTAALAAHMRNGSTLVGATADAAPNPGERFTGRVAQGVAAQLVLRWRAVNQTAGFRYSVVAHAEAPAAGNWTRLAGIVELEADPSPLNTTSATNGTFLPDIELFAEAFIAGVGVQLSDVLIREAWSLPEADAQLYVPCQLDPLAAPDAVIVLPPGGEAYTADIKLCSLGYDQGMRVYDDAGVVIAATDARCGRTDALNGLRIEVWRRYTIVIDGQPGETYGSHRGGCGIHVRFALLFWVLFLLCHFRCLPALQCPAVRFNTHADAAPVPWCVFCPRALHPLPRLHRSRARTALPRWAATTRALRRRTRRTSCARTTAHSTWAASRSRTWAATRGTSWTPRATPTCARWWISAWTTCAAAASPSAAPGASASASARAWCSGSRRCSSSLAYTTRAFLRVWITPSWRRASAASSSSCASRTTGCPWTATSHGRPPRAPRRTSTPVRARCAAQLWRWRQCTHVNLGLTLCGAAFFSRLFRLERAADVQGAPAVRPLCDCGCACPFFAPSFLLLTTTLSPARSYFTSRVNTLSGVAYKDDPTIFAWNLMNEPRCTGCGWALQEWVGEMSQYMKAIDPHHMVTIGEEGFYSNTCDRVYLNPGAGKRRTGIASSPWALQEGQDFVANHGGADIDFSTLHAWPDNWMGFADFSPTNSNQAFDYSFGSEVWKEKLDYLGKWIGAHIEDATAMRKPLVIEEFGKAIPAPVVWEAGLLGPGESMQNDLSIRNKFFSQVYGQVEASALHGGAIGGSNFWVLYRNDGQGGKDPYRITIDDASTFKVVNDHAYNMRAVRYSRPRVCPAGFSAGVNDSMVGDAQFYDTSVVNMTARAPPPLVPRPAGGVGAGGNVSGAAAGEAAAAARAEERRRAYAERVGGGQKSGDAATAPAPAPAAADAPAPAAAPLSSSPPPPASNPPPWWPRAHTPPAGDASASKDDDDESEADDEPAVASAPPTPPPAAAQDAQAVVFTAPPKSSGSGGAGAASSSLMATSNAAVVRAPHAAVLRTRALLAASARAAAVAAEEPLDAGLLLPMGGMTLAPAPAPAAAGAQAGLLLLPPPASAAPPWWTAHGFVAPPPPMSDANQAATAAAADVTAAPLPKPLGAGGL
jgi:hypothetical protein